ncbi:endonuclease/exonuclease/phosphatase family protein [Chloroflexota bacterium]
MTLRLLTLNLRVSHADDGPNNWEHRWPHIRTLLRDVKPNIWVVQECMPNQLLALMAEVAGYVAYPGPNTMIPDASLQNALFVCEPCVLPRNDGVLPLNKTGVIGQVSWDGKEPRLAHFLRFAGWTLVNTHFDAWDCVETRLESARLLVDFLGDAPAVILGDLNCTPDAPPIQVFREAGFSLAKDMLPPAVDRRTFHKFTGQGLAELDYALYRGVQVQDVQIPRPRTAAPYLSDHDPLIVEITI